MYILTVRFSIYVEASEAAQTDFEIEFRALFNVIMYMWRFL